jgi:hypothetical protein
MPKIVTEPGEPAEDCHKTSLQLPLMLVIRKIQPSTPTMKPPAPILLEKKIQFKVEHTWGATAFLGSADL